MNLLNDYSESDEESEPLQPTDVTKLFKPTHPLSRQMCDYVISKDVKRTAFLDQEKLIRLDQIIKRFLQSGKSYNESLRSNKFFNNPCVSEKLIQNLGICEHGTNLGNNFLDPEFWKKQTSYKDLEKQQNEHIKQIEKEKRQLHKESQQLDRKKQNSKHGLSKSQRKRQMKKQKYSKRNCNLKSKGNHNPKAKSQKKY